MSAPAVRANTARTARECPVNCGSDCHDCWTAAVSAELVACTLGQRRRTELRTDALGKVLHAFATVRRVLAALA